MKGRLDTQWELTREKKTMTRKGMTEIVKHTDNFKDRQKRKKSWESLSCCLHTLYQKRQQQISAMAHEWFLKPKLMPPDKHESRRTTTTTTCQHFLRLTVTQAGFQMKTNSGLSTILWLSQIFFNRSHLFPTGLWGEKLVRPVNRSRWSTVEGQGKVVQRHVLLRADTWLAWQRPAKRC